MSAIAMTGQDVIKGLHVAPKRNHRLVGRRGLLGFKVSMIVRFQPEGVRVCIRKRTEAAVTQGGDA